MADKALESGDRKVSDLDVSELQDLVGKAVDERLAVARPTPALPTLPTAGPVPVQGEILPALVHFSTMALL